jgi:hypothetical protein
MNIIGVDLALTYSGVGMIDPLASPKDRLFRFTVGSDKTKSDFTRQIQQLRGVSRVFKKGDLVVAEDFSGSAIFSKNSAKIKPRIEMLGMLKLLAKHKTGNRVMEIQPTTMQSFISGSQKLGKEGVRVVLKSWGFEVANNHESDAYGFALVGTFAWVAWQNTHLDEEHKMPYALICPKGVVRLSAKSIKVAKNVAEKQKLVLTSFPISV